MPELPEVETIANELQHSNVIGVKILRAEVFWPNIIDNLSPKQFAERIKNQSILSIGRRAKYLQIKLSRDFLLIHLRMTGKLSFVDPKEPIHKHEHVRLFLSDGRILIYEDQRKFGRLYLIEDIEQKFAELGLEPLSDQFTFEAFLKVIDKRSTKIKPFLLNQSHIAGLGNIYVDEVLWEAKIHPERKINTLTKQELKALYEAIPKILLKGIDNKGTSLGSHRSNYFSVSGHRGGNQYQLKVFRQEGAACPRCGNPIVKIVVAQRGTHICPHCQNK